MTIDTRLFGRTGWQVSRLGLGTYFLTSDRQVPHSEAVAVVRRALALGVNIVDTAPLYGRGEAEQIVGEALAGDASDTRMIDKVGNFEQSILALTGRHCYRDPFSIRSQFEHSLRLLGRSSIDLLLIHEADWDRWWEDMGHAHGPVMNVLDELRDEGLVDRIGIAVRDAEAARTLCATGRFDAMLYVHYFNLAWQEAGDTVLPLARDQNMGVAIGAPYRQGLLVDPNDDVLAHLRAEKRPDVPPGIIERIRRARVIAQGAGMSLPELGLRFLLGHPLVDSIFVGPRTVGELEQNVAWVQRGALPPDLQEEVLALRAIEPGRWRTPSRWSRRVRSRVAALSTLIRGH